jgi:hypothetical protein
MSIPGISGGTVNRAPTYTPPSNAPDPAQSAERVLNTGSRWGRDDYDARMVELGKELAKGDAEFGRRVMAEIMKRDPAAMESWLQPERANAMRSSGRLTVQEVGGIATAFAAAYNSGDFRTSTVTVGTDPKKGGAATAQMSQLDSFLGGYYEVGGLGAAPDRVQNAQRARAFLDFINTSSSPQVTEFRQKYGQHLIDQYVTNSAFRFNQPTKSNAAAGIAANLLTGDINKMQVATDVLAKYSFDDVKTIMEAAASSNGLYSEQAIKVDAQARQLNARDISVPNGSALLFNAVALSKGPNAQKVALDFARLPANAPKIFDPHILNGSKGNVDGLALAINAHSTFVFDKLATYDSTLIRGDVQQYMQNAAELGTLFKVTLFNPDSTYRNMVQDAVKSYAGTLKVEIEKDGNNPNAASHLSMLSAAITDGVRQGYVDQAKAQAAQKEILGFVLDIALAGIPAGKWVNKAVEDKLKATFPTNAKLQDVLNGLSGKLVDKGQSKLTDDAKKAIIDALGPKAGNLEIARNLANELRAGFFNSIGDQNPEKLVLETQYNQILNGLQLARK